MPRLLTTETGMTWSVPTGMGDTGSGNSLDKLRHPKSDAYSVDKFY